jgi:hypothetical protein
LLGKTNELNKTDGNKLSQKAIDAFKVLNALADDEAKQSLDMMSGGRDKKTDQEKEHEEWLRKALESQKNYNEGMVRIDEMTKIFGDSVSNNVITFDAANEKIQLQNKFFKEQLELYGALNPEVIALGTNLRSLVKGDQMQGKGMNFLFPRLVSTNKPQDYQLSAKDAASQIFATDKTGMLYNAQVSMARTAVKLPNTINEKEYIAKLKTIHKAMTDIANSVNSLLSSYTNLLDAQQNKAITAIEAIAKRQGKSAEWVAKERAKIEAEYGKKKKAAALAEAAINIAVAITSALTLPHPYNFIAAAITAAAGAVQIATIMATPMAEGGIVPGGYPNDTYPARLTSGEMVVPPGKLSSVLGQGNNKIRLEFKPVEFKIGMHEFTGMLEMADTINNAR